MKLKLLFITGSFSDGGGTANVLTTLVNNLHKEKYDITILEYVDSNVKKEPINDNIKLLSVIIKNKYPHTKELKNLFCHHPRIIKQILNLNGYDIVIAWDSGAPTFIFPAFITEKKIAWIHSEIAGLKPSALEYPLQKKAWNLADKIVSVSNKPLRSLESIFPQYIYKASVIYNGTDQEKITAMASVKIPYVPNFKDNTLPLLCIVGRLDGTKNQALAVHTLSYLVRHTFKCNLLLIGDGGKRKELEQLVEDLKLDDYVLFAGFKSNPYPLIEKADLICLTSFSETWGMVICEGMVLGKPFVTTPVSGASEELTDNEKCGLVADYEPKKYAECIKSILTDKNKYIEMSKCCKEHIKKFSVKAAVESFDNLINSLSIESVSNKIEKPSRYLLAQFANVCVFSGIYHIKPAKRLFWNTKSIYNFCKFCYYIIRAFCMILFYPFFFIKYLFFALKLQKKYAS